MPAKNGRWKPCKRCGTPFWCTKSVDVGGAFRERKYCGRACSVAACTYTFEQGVAVFWANVEKTEGCWLWRGVLRFCGYGNAKAPGKRTRSSYAHRLSWELANGTIPKGMHVLHKCDTPACVRPEHLFLGTHQENMTDMAAKGRSLAGEKSFSAKLTDEQVRRIRSNPPSKWKKGKWIGAGQELEEYAKPYGVSPTTIRNVLARRSWRHLP